MLIWICALHCEAKPVIDYYRLRKSHDESAFDLYRGEDMYCVVSGVGKTASASAVGWVAGRLAEQASLTWINLGVAGSGGYPIGDALLLDKVVDADSGERFYPVPPAVTRLPGGCCVTLGSPSLDYREDSLFDMEASGFMHAALRFSSAEMTQSIKVVSDNRAEQTGKDRGRVSELLQARIDPVVALADTLLDLDREIGERAAGGDSWRELVALAHFSQTQKTRLRALWRYLANRDFDHDELIRDLARHKTAGAIIARMEGLSYEDSEGL